MEQQKYFEIDYKRYFEEGLSKSSKYETAFAKVLFAQSYCYQLAILYWEMVVDNTNVNWPIRTIPIALPELKKKNKVALSKHAKKFSSLPPEEAGYQISLIYQSLLPKDYRNRFGVYYTPNAVVKRMLDDSKTFNVNLKKAKVIDPSSGGAAYLAPLCRRMINRKLNNNAAIIKDIEKRLLGIELDPFSAWFSQFLVDCVLAEVAPCKRQPKNIVLNGDALSCASKLYSSFDYVIGNPPYGIVDNELLKNNFGDVISGKINLYQLFFKVAFLLAKNNGYIHFVTPTGFIGGHYFRKLRTWIEDSGDAVMFQFFESRTAMFKGVQQEIVISTFKKGTLGRSPRSMTLEEDKDGNNLSNKYETHAASFQRGLWIFPKTKEENVAAKLYVSGCNNLEDLGFEVKTGYLVPHRSQSLIGNRKKRKSIPIIWSEAIYNSKLQPERAYEKGRYRWYTASSESGILTRESIVIKRTSSKEQKRRIQAARITKTYLKKYGGFIAENHINVIQQLDGCAIRLSVLEKLMRSSVFDELFKCGSGTVTVSATELRRIPLPTLNSMLLFQQRVIGVNCQSLISDFAMDAYRGVE